MTRTEAWKFPSPTCAFFGELDIWSAKPRWTGSGFTRLVVELADLPGHPARKVAKHHKAALENQLADALAKAGVAGSKQFARELWLPAEGAMVLILIHGDRSYASAAAEAGKKLMRHSFDHSSARS